MYGHSGVTVLFLLLPFASATSLCTVEYPNTTVILLDTYNTSQSWTTLDVDGDDMTWVVQNDGCRETYESSCSNSQRNFLITPYVDPGPAQIITFVVDFSEGNCTFSQCSTNFSLLIYQASESLTESQNLTNYNSISSMVPNGTEFTYNLRQSGQGFYLAFEEASACVIINRVRVLYRQCLEATIGLARYNQSISGETSAGMCVENTEPASSFSAVCQNDGTFDFTSSGCLCAAGYEPDNNTTCIACTEGYFKSSENEMCMVCPMNSDNVGTSNSGCECDANHTRQDPSDRSSPCSECETDFFLMNERCTECPSGSFSNVSTDAECTCRTGLATRNGSKTTTSDKCIMCRADYFREVEGGNCMMCPGNSNRLFGMSENMCQCSNNRATLEDRSTTTTAQDCDGCASGFFNNATSGVECVSCPNNSMSVGASNTSCVCNPGTRLPGSQGTSTVFEPCSGCAASYFRINGSCVNCPGNSERTSPTADEGVCPCRHGYARDPEQVQQDCLPIIGFSNDTFAVKEGRQLIIILISTSQETGYTVTFERQSEGAVREPINHIISNAVNPIEIPLINVADNDIGLENDTTFSLSISNVTPAILFIGGFASITYYKTTTVVVQDDDVVEVGFAKDSDRLSSSSTMVAVTINRGIASDLTLSISSDTDGVLRSSTVLFQSGDSSRTVNVMIDISNLNSGDTVELQLEYNGPSQLVAVGGGSTSRTISISLEEFPVAAIIGISAAGAGLAILLLLVVILCLCVCRLRVNRQGFYHTYEDKVSEPPTMLRYSASLRSISSQTVIPPAEGKTASKENEFYV